MCADERNDMPVWINTVSGQLARTKRTFTAVRDNIASYARGRTE